VDRSHAVQNALERDRLLAEAVELAGASGFRDTSFVPALDRVLEIPGRLPFTENGLAILRANLLRFLVNRLRYEADVARHPEILDEDVSDPIVVIGLPRSGTTKLQRLLSANPGVQATYAWRMFNPAPFPGEIPGDPTPRIEWARAMTPVVSATNEAYKRIHEFHPLEPDETSFVPLANFDYVMQWIPTPCGEYLDWVRTRPRTAPLGYLKRMLQYLQWQDGGRRDRPWLLKNPGHTGEIEEMLEVFPGATFLMAERDLSVTMASIMQMMWEIYETSFSALDRVEHGRGQLEYWSHELRRYLEQRRRLDDRIRILEAPYRRLVSDSLGIAREIYELHGRPLGAQGEQALLAWERNHPPQTHGKFEYSLDDFGCTRADVEAAFGPVAEQWRGR
jgi:hypothetical protein